MVSKFYGGRDRVAKKLLYPYLICHLGLHVHALCHWYTVKPQSCVWQHCKYFKYLAVLSNLSEYSCKKCLVLGSGKFAGHSGVGTEHTTHDVGQYDSNSFEWPMFLQ
jgi:hypothetical protein